MAMGEAAGPDGDRGKYPSGRSRRLRRGTQGVVRHLPADPAAPRIQDSPSSPAPFPLDPLQARKRRPSRPLPPPAAPPRLVTRNAPKPAPRAAPRPAPSPRTAPLQRPELRTRSGTARRMGLPSQTYPSYDDQEETPAEPLPLPEPSNDAPGENDTVETRIQSLEEEKEQLIRALREREEALEASENRFRSVLAARQEALTATSKKYSNDLEQERQRSRALSVELQRVKTAAEAAEQRLADELDKQVGRSRKLERERAAHTKKLLDNMERRWRQRRDDEIQRLQKLGQEKVEAAIAEARAEVGGTNEALNGEVETWKQRFEKAEAERQRIEEEAAARRRGLEGQLAALQRSSRRQIKTLSSKAEVEKRESLSILEERSRVLEQELSRIKEEQVRALARERERSVRENAKLVEEGARARRDLTVARKELGRFRKGWQRIEAIKREQSEARSKLERQLSEARAENQRLRDREADSEELERVRAEAAELKADLARQRQEHVEAWTQLAHDLRARQEQEAADRAAEMARLRSVEEEAREEAEQWRREAAESSTRLRRLQDLAEKSGVFQRPEPSSEALTEGIDDAVERASEGSEPERAGGLEDRLSEALKLLADRDKHLAAAAEEVEDERRRARAIEATAGAALAAQGEELERELTRRQELAAELSEAEETAAREGRRGDEAEAELLALRRRHEDELQASRERGRRSLEALQNLARFLEHRLSGEGEAAEPAAEEGLLAFEALAEGFGDAHLGSRLRSLQEENASLKARMQAFEEGGELFEAEDAALEAASGDQEELFADRLLHWICLRESREAPWTRLATTHPMSPLRHQAEHSLWNQETMSALCRRLDSVLGEVGLEGEDPSLGGPRAIAQLGGLSRRLTRLVESAAPEVASPLGELCALLDQELAGLKRLEASRVALLTDADPGSLRPSTLAKLAALAIADRRIHEELLRLTAAVEAIAAAL